MAFSMKIKIRPFFRGVDDGDGGIRRVVEAQYKYLPDYNIQVVEDNPDIIAVHAGQWLSEGAAPVVAHCHGLYWYEYEWHKWAHDLNKDVVNTLRRADAVTAPSYWVAYALQRNMWLRPTVLYHGVDASLWTPGTNAGYILWNKNRVDAICDPSPMNELAKLNPTRKFISTYGESSENVILTGRTSADNAREHVRNAGVYLCTTRETFGIGTLEAMACGVPVLGYRWGGQAEFITHKKTGYLVTPGNMQELNEGLQYCFDNRYELGNASRQLVSEGFTWSKAISRYASLYERVLSNVHSEPRVSVIVTCYNLGKYLEECINSIRGQVSYEIIIVDDNSTDDSYSVALNLQQHHPSIEVIRTPQNLYLAGALNYAISQARGQYIIPLDADNMLGANTIDILSSALDSNSDIDIAYGGMEVLEPNGHRWTSDWPPRAFDFRAQMSHRNQLPSTSMYRKRVWERVGGYRRRCRTAEDADFWCRVTSLGAKPVKATDAVTLIYRNRDDSMSRSVADWPWHEWYPWSRIAALTPPAAAIEQQLLRIPTCEPPVISVIIPVGPTHTEIVVDAIDSVVAQTYQKWEVIVVNDSGVEIPWLHPFVHLYSTGGARGPAAARTVGLTHARGRLWIPLDADDILHPEALQRMSDAHDGINYVYTDWIVHETKEIKQAPDYDCQEVVRLLPHAVTCLYTHKQWREAPFDEHLDAWEDWDFIISLASRGYCGIHLSEPLLQYRMSAGQRREQQYADRERLKGNIYAKWKRYIEGEEQLMACTSCSKQAQAQAPPAPQQTQQVPNDAVLLEYTKPSTGVVTYKGQATGTLYRFGGDPAHKTKYVYASDAQYFLQLIDFKVAVINSAGSPLVAVGPPVRA